MPKLVKIKKIVDENEKVKTFFLDTKLDVKPGQFIMVWIKGVDEKPFSLSSVKGDIAVTVEVKGEFTRAMFKLEVGDEVGIRGPYGNGYSAEKGAVVVAGGLGLAPLKPLIGKISGVEVVYGAKTKDVLIFKDMIEKFDVCTDDGSFGEKAFTTDILERKLKGGKVSIVYACGPEVMLLKVFEVCEKYSVDCEVSLERYMKCGFGVCAQCVCEDQMVCKDGPVFGSDMLRGMSEFGKSARLKSGKLVSLKEYYG